jgi:hypothetical protein
MAESQNSGRVDVDAYAAGWHDDAKYSFKAKPGLSEAVVRQMSEMKSEPKWMRESTSMSCTTT